jgi:hypothetical protein
VANRADRLRVLITRYRGARISTAYAAPPVLRRCSQLVTTEQPRLSVVDRGGSSLFGSDGAFTLRVRSD